MSQASLIFLLFPLTLALVGCAYAARTETAKKLTEPIDKLLEPNPEVLKQESFWNQKYHQQMGIALDFSHIHLQDPSLTGVSTEYNVPGYMIELGSAENLYTFGFGMGGDLKIDTSYKTSRISYIQLALDFYLNSEKLGHFVEIKNMGYKINVTDLNTSSNWRDLLVLYYGYCLPINENLKWSIGVSSIFDNISMKKFEYAIQVKLIGTHTEERETTPKNWLRFQPVN